MIDSCCDKAAPFHFTHSSNGNICVFLEREKTEEWEGEKSSNTRTEVLYLPRYKQGEKRYLMEEERSQRGDGDRDLHDS